MARHLQTIPQDWLDMILTKTATLCMDEAGSVTGPAGGRQQRRGDHQVRYRHEALQKREEFRRDGPEDVPEIPHNCRPRLADYTGVRDHGQQHKRCHDAACHAGQDETAGAAPRPGRL